MSENNEFENPEAKSVFFGGPITGEEKQLQKRARPQNDASYLVKIRGLVFIIGLCFVFVGFRFFQLQVLNGEEYKKRSLSSRKQIVAIPSYRGEIYINSGARRLVENRPTFTLYFVPKNFVSAGETASLTNRVEQLAQQFDIPEKNIFSVLRKGRSNPYRAYPIKTQVSREEVYFLAENLERFPGMLYGADYKRFYNEGDIYSHITGYIRPISVREYQRKKDLGYRLTSLVGKTGIEGMYDLPLRGREGYKIQIVDIKNRVKDEYLPEDGEVLPGKDISLTIRSDVQEALYRTLQGYTGGAVVTHVATGEVLGLYSYPSYDPNIFVGELAKDTFNLLKDDPERPFLNRVIQGEYSPSSIFKLVLTLAAMETPAVDLNSFRSFCEGKIIIGGLTFGCEGYHSEQNYFQAIANSCNVFFYNLGIKMGPKVINKYSTSFFNLGKKTGIDLMYERPGIVPSQKWKIENRGSFWWDGDTANMSIGHGFTQATILQVNTLTAAIAGNGIAYKPHLLSRISSVEDANDTYIEKPEPLIELPVSTENLRKLQSAMRAVVKWGTARRIDSKRIAVAGKTGTAQTVVGKEPHSWFTAYAPYGAENPEDVVAVTVFLEHAGHGGEMAAPFAQAILESIFLKRDPLLVVKEILQPWKSKTSLYEEWLSRRGESKLPESYFKKPLIDETNG